MPIIRITKEQVEKSQKAREKALKEDSEFKALEEEREKEIKKAIEQRGKEAK